MFGHGSGKLLFKDAQGNCPFTLRDPISGDSINTCYSEGEDFQTLWGDISTSYEECKADTAGLYLLKFKEMYEDFNITKYNDQATWADLLLSQMYADATGGLDTLPGSYNAETKKWKQAHSQARYVILQFLMQNQKEKIISIEMVRENGKIKDYMVNIDKNKMANEGWNLLKQLL
jgi:dipeptidyl-peptidase-3